MDAYVRKESLATAAAGRRFYKRNLLDDVYEPFDPDEVIRRASIYLDQRVEYSLFGNNCEHFVNWCRYGVARSLQGETAKAVTGTIMTAAGVCGATSETLGGGAALQATLMAVGATGGTLGAATALPYVAGSLGGGAAAGVASLTGAAVYARSNPRVVRGSLKALGY